MPKELSSDKYCDDCIHADVCMFKHEIIKGFDNLAKFSDELPNNITIHYDCNRYRPDLDIRNAKMMGYLNEPN